MWKYFLALLVTAGIITGAMYLYRHRHQLFRPDIAKAGGTLLVFEVDGEPPDDLEPLVETLQKRFDLSGGAGIVVRGAGEGQVEVGVPNGKTHDDQVAMVKRLVTRRGKLEVLVLSNRLDDEAAINAAMILPKGEKLDVPPRRPRDPKTDDTFPVKLPGEPAHRYRWGRLSEPQVRMLRMDPAGLSRENPMDLPRVEASVRTGQPFSPNFQPYVLAAARKLSVGADPTLFVLLREPAPGQEITPDLVQVQVAGGRGRYSVLFRFGREASGRLADITNRNLSTYDGVSQRQLAILLDGEVITLSVMSLGVRRGLEINGEFTREEAEEVVMLLRGGALPCRLKARPVRETVTGKSR
jgi:preprotein translocase subunit SecD